jgi:hypothetical protein
MATENAWRARKIQAELSKLGIRVSLATVSRYVPKPKPDPSQQQRWMTFLRGPAGLARGRETTKMSSPVWTSSLFPPFDSDCCTSDSPSIIEDDESSTSTSPRIRALAG